MRTFRILIVEDDARTADQLTELLRDNSQNITVDVALSQEIASTAVNETALAGNKFDVAILDFKVSDHAGEVPQTNQKIFQELPLDLNEKQTSPQDIFRRLFPFCT